MKKILVIILIIIIPHCSLDTKTGIWENSSDSKSEKDTNKRFEDFEVLYAEEKSFKKIITPSSNLKIKFDPIKKLKVWPDEFYKNTNNLDNFIYTDSNQLIFKGKKLSGSKINNKFLFDGKNIITADHKGNIIVYSLKEDSIILKYNFYKKKYKKIPKRISLGIQNNIIYASDNIGYVYALDYINKKLIWAKNYKIPFRSNLKVLENKIIIADQDNILYLLNKNNGDKIKSFPTEENILKNNFFNSLAAIDNNLYFLNTYGSLYSIDHKNLRINWFRNLNQSTNLNPNNIFFSNPIVLYNDKIILSTDPYLYILNLTNGSSIFKISISSLIKPIVSNKNIFLITKDNLLVCINLETGKIIYSIDISNEIAKFLGIKQKTLQVNNLSLLNDELFIFLKNSYVVQFSPNGKLNDIYKLPQRLSSFPIFIDGSMFYLNKRNKLIVVN